LIGMAKNFRMLFELSRNRALGINSAVNRIMRVAMMVCNIRTMDSELKIGPKALIINEFKAFAIAIPKITRATLLPSNNVPNILEGFLTKNPRIFADNSPFFLSSSILSLLELIKAISIPEKNAEKTSAIITIYQSFITRQMLIIIFY